MEQLTIVGTEGMRLVLATEQGQRFTLDIDDMLRTEVRRAGVEVEARPKVVGPSPREIQAHIRAGLSAEEVAELLGCDVERVRLFEGPVLAEREHIVGRALAMPVLTGIRLDQDENPTFGTAIHQKLAELSAAAERWTSWKTDEGWIVKLTFSAGGVDHDARWTFDPRRSALAPQNGDATQLSRQGRMPEGLIPRLRALESEEKDASTFDDHAFQEDLPPEAQSEPEEQHADTADLLEALRRKRGQRQAPPSAEADDERPERPVAIFGALDPVLDETPPPAEEQEPEAEAPRSDDDPQASTDTSRRRRRPSMPSWDDIVFGARSDD
ncbi:septation protein SepH [Microbacterium indicum]|uniref:septation protein SepH n=1 Tax=Microbacterium indicum TaxID=358100 RepID=UPI000412E87B|nr:septation protein SepH [Microbacterium indicum]